MLCRRCPIQNTAIACVSEVHLLVRIYQYADACVNAIQYRSQSAANNKSIQNKNGSKSLQELDKVRKCKTNEGSGNSNDFRISFTTSKSIVGWYIHCVLQQTTIKDGISLSFSHLISKKIVIFIDSSFRQRSYIYYTHICRINI